MRKSTQRHEGAGRKIIVFLSLCLCAFALNPTNRLNVLLISIDTLRADRLGSYGYKTKTPAMDALAAESLLFENAISQTPLTLPSHSTIFTGLYPDQHGVRNNENFVLPERLKTLAEFFQDHGYATGAVVGSFSLDSSFGIDQGFQYYEDRIGQGHDPELNRHVERRAEAVWKLGRDWIDAQKKPWFAFLHFFDPHFPYSPPKPYEQSYDGEVAYSDRVIGTIIHHLKQTNRLDNTILILLSDHGESLGEHGEDNHGIFLYDATMKVPLMFRIPGQAAKRIPQQVRLVDVAPTLFELAGFSGANFSGQNLLPFAKGANKDLPAYSESYYANLLMGWAPLHSIRWNNKKWIDAPKPEFYDLLQDPRELKNLYKESDVPPAFRSELKKHSVSKQVAQQERVVDPETQEKLASLGYVTGSSRQQVASRYDPKEGIVLWTQIEAAVRDAQLNRWDAAEKKFRDVLKKQPDNVIAQKFLANVLRKQQRQDEAIALMQRALQSELHQMETRTHMAEAYVEKKDYVRALEQIQIVLRSERDHARGLALAAWLQARLKKDEQALESYARLASIRNLTEEEALQAAAIALTARKNNEAEKYFREALRANGKSSAAWKGVALILAGRQQWEESAEAFQKAGDCPGIKQMMERLQNPSPKIQEIARQCRP